MIELTGIQKRFGKNEVLKGISFSVHPGEFVCITGPSGVGKSTLISILIGAEPFDDGSVNIDGAELRDIPPRALQIYRRRIGVVFQDYKLLWNRTVAENIAFPLDICGASPGVTRRRVAEVLRQMNLVQQADVPCHALSGGEKARTAIGRAIAHKPMIILADEPTGNLDPRESMRIMQLFKDIHAQGATILLATHDTIIVDSLNTRVITLEDGLIARDSIGKYREPPTQTQETVHPSAKEDDPEKPSRKGKGSVKIISTSK
ncbi:MAG: ATP-binding cassette domain-containing protein [Candidatus Peribacteraceae bacterium]|nr:ATP-binding cassette domain-containing protein [Candidatus Peribacteraceae bacterium]